MPHEISYRGCLTVLSGRGGRPRSPRDPGLAALRRAARAALVASSAFAVAQLALRNTQFTTFVVYGCFALLVLGDFGGRRRPRAAAYVGATLVGALLVALGTLATPLPWAAALAMFLVGFWVQFAGVFGSYAAAAQTAPSTALGSRLAGWCIAGMLATLAGTFLWPRFEHSSLQRQAAQTCRALAALLAAERRGGAAPDLAARRTEAQTAVAAVRQSYAATPKRPAGPARRDRAFAELLAELEHILDLGTGLLAPLLTAEHPCLAAGRALAAAMTQTLEGSADLLTGGAPPDLSVLQEARLAHRQALDRWVEEALRDGTAATAILDALQADDALRILSYLTLAAGSNAVLATGRRVDAGLHLPAETPRRAGPVGLVTRVGATVRAHLTPSSPVLHGSLRVGLGLALAVLLSRMLRLDHGFWVVLATLSVLRTTALATGRTTAQALAGTIGGFALSALFLATLGRDPTVLWLSLPCAIFLAAYATSTSTVGCVAGQATFTLTVVILFNLIVPAGWQLGLVRVEDVAIGAGISVVVGLLLWPRGARGEFRQALAELFAGVAEFLSSAPMHGRGRPLIDCCESTLRTRWTRRSPRRWWPQERMPSWPAISSVAWP